MPFTAGSSIRTKLPLAIVSLILVVGLLLSTAAFVTIRRTLHETASDRLTSVSLQFQEQLRNSVAASQARYALAANRPELAAYLADPSSAAEEKALKALRLPLPPQDQNLGASLRDENARLLLTTVNGVTDVWPPLADGRSDWADLISRVDADAANGGRSVIYGNMRPHDDQVWYPIVARVAGPRRAYWVHWRRVANNSPVWTQVSTLLGSEAAFFVANADGSMWTNLGRPAAAPNRMPEPGSIAEYSHPGGSNVLAATQAIIGTPWLLTIEFPTQAIQAPARAFVRTVIGIAAGCIAFGMLVAWIMSRRITAPLEKLTVAADALAAGNTALRVDESRNDELGRLGRSFNAMAAQVQEARGRLERLVERRTGELRVAQESLARREKLALVGHLAGGIGHEIRNPLGVMSNAIYYLQTIQPDASPEVKEYLELLRTQVNLSAKIVNDLLDLSRTTPAKRQPVCVHTLVAERLQRVQTSSADLHAEVPHELPRVSVDPVHAGQVIDNLLNNAVQALDGERGTVRVRAREVDPGFVEIEISDTGPGIQPENMPRIFEPLFTTKARGIGLGLALSKTLAQANGGDLTLASGAGESAIFVFTLPVAGSV